jgi:hypothetical protein
LISFAEPWRPSYELPKDQWQWPAFGCSPFRLCRLFLTSRFSCGALFTDLAQRVRIWPLPLAAETREVSPIVQRKAMRHLLYLGLEKTVADPENALAGESVPMTGNVATSPAWLRIQLSMSLEVLAEPVQQILLFAGAATDGR